MPAERTGRDDLFLPSLRALQQREYVDLYFENHPKPPSILPLRLSRGELYELKVRIAVENRVGRLAERLKLIILGDDSVEPLSPIIEQLSGLAHIHSISFQAGSDVLGLMSEMIRETVKTTQRDFNVKEVPNYEEKGGRVMLNVLLETVKEMLDRGEEPEDIMRRTGIALRSIRNLALFDDKILRQTLYSVQSGDTIDFSVLGNIMKSSAELLSQMEKDNNLPFDDEVVEVIVQPMWYLLSNFDEFIKDANMSRLTGGEETENDALSRAWALSRNILKMIDETHRGEYSSNLNSRDVSFLLTEAFFAHRVHWMDGLDQVLIEMCQKMEGKHKDLAEEMIYQAQAKGLLNPLESQDYTAAGLDTNVYNRHVIRLEEYKKRNRFYDDPREIVTEEGETLGLLLGYLNFAHIGHRGLAYGGILAYQDGETLLISVNMQDTLRDLESERNGVPVLSFEQRLPLILKAYAGFNGELGYITTIDKVAGPDLTPPARIQEFFKETGLQGLRVCGFDRRSLTPKGVNPIIIGLRGYDLRMIIRDNSLLKDLEDTFPEQDIVFVLLQGSSEISSTLVYNLAKNHIITGKDESRYLNRLKSYIVRGNVEPILKLVKESMKH